MVAVGGIVATASLSLVFTMWIVRPQAPDGTKFAFTYDEAVSAATRDVTGWLDQAVPGAWTEKDRAETHCTDRFGRWRGAVYGGPFFQVGSLFTAAQFEQFEHVVGGPDREVQAERFGRPESFRGQRHDRIVIRLRTFQDANQSTIEIVTPCLRAG